jgi:hypothetical protein
VRKSLRWWFDAQFPKLSPQDWLAFARRTCREHSGALVPDDDLKLARTLQGANLGDPATLWNEFDALRVPLMVIAAVQHSSKQRQSFDEALLP